MFTNEKIDSLKKLFSSKEFRDPFTEGSAILKAIEREFILSKGLDRDLNNLNQHLNKWADNIKNKIAVKSTDLKNREEWLDKLDADKNYWMVVANRNSNSLKNRVFDCKPNAVYAVFSIIRSDFFIVDKKYQWFSYFRVDEETLHAAIFKSGIKLTPFEL